MKKNKTASSEGDKPTVKELSPAPSFIADRLALWDKLKAQYESNVANKPKNGIKVTLPDGKVVDATAWVTTAYDVAKGIRYVLLLYSVKL